MRVAFILLVGVGVCFAASTVLLNKHSQGSQGSAVPQQKTGESNDDYANDLSGWQPPGMANDLGAMLEPFSPHAQLSFTTLTLGPLQSVSRQAAPAAQSTFSTGIQILDVAVAKGAGFGIRYQCTATDENNQAQDCSQTICVCTPGTALQRASANACGKKFLATHVSAAGMCYSGAGSSVPDSGSIIMHPASRSLQFFSLSTLPVTVQICSKRANCGQP